MSNYGKELIIDMHEVKNTHLFNRKDLEEFFIALCNEIDMVREDLHFWDYQDDPEEYERAEAHLKGTSAIQFIKTSNITVHTLGEMERIYFNIFSCKDFDAEKAKEFCSVWFDGKIINSHTMDRV